MPEANAALAGGLKIQAPHTDGDDPSLYEIDLCSPAGPRGRNVISEGGSAFGPTAVAIETGDPSSLKGSFVAALPNGEHSIYSAISNLTNNIVGAGIIGIPFAMEEAGLYLGIICLVVCAYLTSYSIRLLVRIGTQSGIGSYEELCETFMGGFGRWLITLSMFLFAYGAMIAYLLIIGDTLPVVLEHWSGVGWMGNRPLMLAGCSVALCLPLCLLKDIGRLGGVSAFSMVVMCIVVGVVVIRGPSASQESGGVNLQEDGRHREDAFAFAHRNVAQGFAAICFAFVCHHTVYLVRNSMFEPHKWGTVTYASMLVAVLLSLLTGIVGYMSFVRCTHPNILNNFDVNDEAVNAARIMLAIAMIFTYPMEFFVARQATNSMFFASGITGMRHAVITAVLFTTTVAIGMVLRREDLRTVLEITGGTSACLLGFICPACIYFASEKDATPGASWFSIMLRLDSIVPVILLLIGSVVFLANLFYAGRDMAMQSYKHPDFCPLTGLNPHPR